MVSMILDIIMEAPISPLSDSTVIYPPSPRRYFQNLFSIVCIFSIVVLAVTTTAFPNKRPGTIINFQMAFPTVTLSKLFFIWGINSFAFFFAFSNHILFFSLKISLPLPPIFIPRYCTSSSTAYSPIFLISLVTLTCIIFVFNLFRFRPYLPPDSIRAFMFSSTSSYLFAISVALSANHREFSSYFQLYRFFTASAGPL